MRHQEQTIPPHIGAGDKQCEHLPAVSRPCYLDPCGREEQTGGASTKASRLGQQLLRQARPGTASVQRILQAPCTQKRSHAAATNIMPSATRSTMSAPMSEQALWVLLHLITGDLEGHHLLRKASRMRRQEERGRLVRRGMTCTCLAGVQWGGNARESEASRCLAPMRCGQGPRPATAGTTCSCTQGPRPSPLGTAHVGFRRKQQVLPLLGPRLLALLVAGHNAVPRLAALLNLRVLNLKWREGRVELLSGHSIQRKQVLLRQQRP